MRLNKRQLSRGELPSEWRRSVIVPINKEKGSKQD